MGYSVTGSSRHNRHGGLIVIGAGVANGEPITAATLQDGIVVATADVDLEPEPKDAMSVCEGCFVSDHPQAAYILQAVRERGWWVSST